MDTTYDHEVLFMGHCKILFSSDSSFLPECLALAALVNAKLS